MQAAEGVLLETLNPDAIGQQCSLRLAEAMQRSQGFSNLIRVDAGGRVSCAAGPVGTGPTRDVQSDWFQTLKRGAPVAVARVDTGP